MSAAQSPSQATLPLALQLFQHRIHRLEAALAYKKRKGYTPEYLRAIGAARHWSFLTWDILTFESRLKAADLCITRSEINTVAFDELLGRLEQSMRDIDKGEKDGGCVIR